MLTTKSVRRDYVTGTLYAMSHQSGYCKGEEGRVCVHVIVKVRREEFVYSFCTSCHINVIIINVEGESLCTYFKVMY